MKASLQVVKPVQTSSPKDAALTKNEAQTSQVTAAGSGFGIALLANILWGSSFLASKYTLTTWGPFTASALRFALALTVMGICLPLFRYKLKLPKLKTDVLGLTFISLSAFGLLYPLQLEGLKLISSGLSAAIMLTSPLFVTAFGHLFLRETFSTKKIMALALGVSGGCILIFPNSNPLSGSSHEMLLGSLLTLGASMSLAGSVVLTRKFALKLDTANLTFWSMLGGFLMLAPFAVTEVASNPPQLPSAAALGSLVYLAVICSALCFLLWNSALAKSSAKDLASTMHIKTPTAMILGALIASEQISIFLVIGSIIVAFGVWLSQRPEKVS